MLKIMELRSQSVIILTNTNLKQLMALHLVQEHCVIISCSEKGPRRKKSSSYILWVVQGPVIVKVVYSAPLKDLSLKESL